jgi:biotin synthase
LIHVSIGTAGVLGLSAVPMAVPPTTAYLMVGGRCAMNCAFCAQARESEASELALSRVTWPRYPLQEVCTLLGAAEREGRVRRCCIQVTAGQDYYRRALDVVRQVRQVTTLPVNVAIRLQTLDQATRLFAAGVDRIGLGLDAACERVYVETKGGRWADMLCLIEEVTLCHPGRISVHLVVGLGETEREMVERMMWTHRLGAGIGLFAFTPLRGTVLGDHAPPPLAQYRRMQAARWLIVHHRARPPGFCFDDRGTLVGIRLADGQTQDLSQYLVEGDAFRTSGCPDCNRPFYNERPGGPMYNYARPLTLAEACQAISEAAVSVDPRMGTE